jgi:catabolite regulation protein CreA
MGWATEEAAMACVATGERALKQSATGTSKKRTVFIDEALLLFQKSAESG